MFSGKPPTLFATFWELLIYRHVAYTCDLQIIFKLNVKFHSSLHKNIMKCQTRGL
jgi:hypothetical protein